MRVVALIIGIDGWEQYTLPLVESIMEHEPTCDIFVIDNASAQPYPALPNVYRTERLCYSAAINTAAKLAGNAAWYIVLSNDVLCTGPFAHILADAGDLVVGPCLKQNMGWTYLEGWCVAIPAKVWDALKGWDENYQVSSWEDVDFSVSALEHGFNLGHCPDFPFVHLDQRQRFSLVSNYWASESHNVAYFHQKHGEPWRKA